MLECFPDGIEVHDAIYSKMLIVNTKLIEDFVFNETRFRIRVN